MSEYVIIGASAAGLSCCDGIREADPKGKITLISDEKLALYSRCLLTYFISGKIEKDGLKFKEDGFYKANNIEAIHGVKALSLDVKNKEVRLDNGKKVKFDKLLIATGASPKRLDIPGEDRDGVLGLRKIEDAEAIISILDEVKTAVILGGGLIGLRDAYALNLRGKSVKVVVKSPQILSQMLDKDAAEIIESKLAAEGIEIMKGLAAKEVAGKKRVEGVLLDNGSNLPCQMVIIGKGVVPNLDIVKETEIKVNYGIIVNEYLQTSVNDIYAAGDVAEGLDITRAEERINAIWPVAIEQGKIAGLNMAGKKTVYDGSCMMNATDFFGLATISIGITKPKGSEYEELTQVDKKNFTYKKIVLKNNIICGLILVNRINNAGVYGALIKKRIDVTGIKGQLLNDNFDYASIVPLVKSHPDKFKDKEFKETTITF